MSLQRFANFEKINSSNSPTYGTLYTDEYYRILKSKELYTIIKSVNPGTLFTEAHVYTLGSDYLGSVYDNKLLLDNESNSLFVDAREVFNTIGVTKGSYKLVVNVFLPIYGRPNSDSKPPVLIDEISPDRNEIRMILKDGENKIKFQQFRDYIFSFSYSNLLNFVSINFGGNNVYRILNIRFDEQDPLVFYVKIHGELSDSVEIYDSAWFGIEAIDSYIDNVILTREVDLPKTTRLRGPKFDIDVDQWDSHATMYQSWNQLLDTNAPTAQRIIDNIISGSGQATINIDYTDFNNFIFYSSASERLSNFKSKIEQIELYNNDISIIENSVTGNTNLSVFSRRSADTIQSRIDTIISSFDPFERWMYYHQSGSIFTHDISGSNTPWPKYELNNKYVLHPSTSNIVLNWFSSSYEAANQYDLSNQNSLWWSIPEHVLMDTNNSEYITFVNMVGQHFDVMYMYVNALTKIHERDEHPERGASNDLLYYIAKSFGWNLQNSRGLSSLWLYKLGTDYTGSMQTSSGMDVLPHERQTQLIWRRIVNNLPYLLKTKGTERSIKALMSIYGIPQTLLSIKEYGGPGIDSDIPVSVENRYAYKLNLNGDLNERIQIPQDSITVSQHGWGRGSWCEGTGTIYTKSTTPFTYEFRFSTEQSASLGAIPLFAKLNNGGLQPGPGYDVNTWLSLVSALELTGTASFSGSLNYGKILYESAYSGELKYSDWLPIFDGDLWTVRIYDETPLDSTSDPLERVQIARASDYLYGRIAHESAISMSAQMYPPVNSVWLGGQIGVYYNGPVTKSLLEDVTFGQHEYKTWFSGSVQSYKEYYTNYSNSTFYSHVLNPGAYHVDSPSGSFYSLYRYYPLGADVQRYDHTTHLFLSSSHPDRSQTPSVASIFINSGDQDSQYESINETYYAQVPKIGGIPIRGEKIRIEDNYLKYELSPESRGEYSEYDDKPTDTNRLAVVFSTSDYLNRDITNHMGFSDLDTWMADPEEEFRDEYKTLRVKRNEYFQKFSKKPDMNSFIRLLSLYDYTFFEQIKQLVPGRADLITGILVEPYILDRSKVQISKRPKVSNPQWSKTIEYSLTQSGAFPTYEGDIILQQVSDFTHFYETGSIQLNEVAHTDYRYLESEIINDIYIDSLVNQEQSGTIIVRDPYDSSVSGSNIQQVDNMRCDSRYLRKTCYYDAYPIRYSMFKGSELVTGSLSYWNQDSINSHASITEQTSSYRWDNIVGDYRFKYGVYLPVGSEISQSVSTVKDSYYLVRVYVAPWIPGSTEFTYNPNYDYSDFHSLYLSVIPETGPVQLVPGTRSNLYMVDTLPFSSGSKTWLREERYIIKGSGNDTIKIGSGVQLTRVGGVLQTVDGGLVIPPGPYENGISTEHDGIFLFTVEMHPLQSEWQEGWTKRAYEMSDRSYIREGCALEKWYYQIEECSTRNNSRFKGSKLSGPGINIDSVNTVDGGPVVVVQTTNPNNISLGQGGTEGNLRLE